MNTICPICKKDFSKQAKILGPGFVDVLNFHIFQHSKYDTIDTLIKGLKELRDGGYGCKERAQEIIDSVSI